VVVKQIIPLLYMKCCHIKSMSITTNLFYNFLFFFSSSLVAKFTHIMCGEVGNPGSNHSPYTNYLW